MKCLAKLALLCFLLLSVALDACEISAKREFSKREIRLKDIADGCPQDQRIVAVLRPGEKRIINFSDLNLKKLNLNESIKISRSYQLLEKEFINRLINSNRPNGLSELVLLKKSISIRTPLSGWDSEIKFIKKTKSIWDIELAVTFDGVNYRYPLKAFETRNINCYTWSQQPEIGSIITNSNVSAHQCMVTHPYHDFATQVIGKRLTGKAVQETPIMNSSLSNAISAGQSVEGIEDSGILKIKVKTTALKGGSIGDCIPVLFRGKRFESKILDDSNVLLASSECVR